MPATTPRHGARRLLLLESEAQQLSTLDQSDSEEDRALRQSCRDQGELSLPSSHIRLEFIGGGRGSGFNQGVSRPLLDHCQRALCALIEPTAQADLCAHDQEGDRQDEGLGGLSHITARMNRSGFSLAHFEVKVL